MLLLKYSLHKPKFSLSAWSQYTKSKTKDALLFGRSIILTSGKINCTKVSKMVSFELIEFTESGCILKSDFFLSFCLSTSFASFPFLGSSLILYASHNGPLLYCL